MLPVLLDLKFLKIYTFGIFLVLALFWGMFMLWKNSKLTTYKDDDIFDGLLFSLLGGFIFSRLVYVILNFSKFGFDPLKFILINGYPGLSLYGALFGGIFFLYLFFNRKKIKFMEAVDYFIPAVFVALAIGKIGSFFGGVDVGTPTQFFLAITYSGLAQNRHIPGLYESVLFFLGAYVSYKMVRMIRRDVFPHGFALYFFAFYFSLVTLLIDKFKANHLYFFGVNFNRAIALVLVLFFAGYFIFFFRQTIKELTQHLKVRIATYGKKTDKRDSGGAQKQAGGR